MIKHISLIFALILPLVMHSQEVKRLCETTEMNRRALLENPDAVKALAELNEFTAEYEKVNGQSKQVYIIPVVFHVVHNYGPENISKDQILDCMRIFNEDFRKMNADTSYIIPEFKGIAADCMIEFRLAKIDPDGNCTDGIERVVSNLTYNANEDTKMAVPAWPRNKYLNVWTVSSLENGAAGYSYYPSSVSGSWGEKVDGIILLSSYVGSIGTSAVSHGRTLTHEAGHYLNLMHPWGNSNDPGLPDNCYDDDQVGDTPNTIGHTSCDLYAVTCGTLDNVQNYMDYSYCGNMYTQGQAVRMQATLNSTVSGRSNLWSNQNLIETGTYDGYNESPCIPVADFSASPLTGCSAYSVNYKDISWNSDSISIYNWTFPGGTPSFSTDRNPVIEYSTPGKFDATLLAGNSSGSTSLYKQNYINVIDLSEGLQIPVSESFESTTFPDALTESDSWLAKKTGNNGWERVTIAAHDGIASVSVNNSNNVDGDVSELITPNINSDSLGPYANITFSVAYAQKDDASTDMLRIWISYDCGTTWKIRYSRIGATLATNGGGYVSDFIPDASEWREETVSLGYFSSYPDILLKFACTSGGGNQLYLDKINLNFTTVNETIDFAESYMPQIYPNPGSGIANVEWFSPAGEDITIKLYDISGKCVYNNNITSKEGFNHFEIDRENLPSGLYMMKLHTPKGETGLHMIKN